MFQEKWRCSEPEWASVTGEVKFNGFEVRTTEGGLEIFGAEGGHRRR